VKQLGKRILSLMLCLCMVLSMMPASAIADEAASYVATPSEATDVVEQPSEEPEEQPSEEPEEQPSEEPVEQPSEKPVEQPSEEPVEQPSEEPVEQPSEEPTEQPSEEPTEQPSEEPTEQPSEEPTEEPTDQPSEEPTEEPTEEPVEQPTEALEVSIRSDVQHVFVGEGEIPVFAAITGGTAPYTVELKVENSGETVYESAEQQTQSSEASFVYEPTKWGVHVLTVKVEDAAGVKERASVTVHVAEKEYEYASSWEKSVAGVKLTGDWRVDLVAIARTQIGVEESEKNFIFDEDGVRRAYTRYGEWFGAQYSEWCGMFVAFCAHYAGLRSGFPVDAHVGTWAKKLDNAGALVKNDLEYVPAIGDLVFFDWEHDGVVDHMGIVEKVDGYSVYTIQGNAEGAVRRYEYSMGDSDIYGYGSTRVLMEQAGIDVTDEPIIEEVPEEEELTVVGKAVTLKGGINVRNKANGEYVVAQISQSGTEVEVYGVETNEDTLWYYIKSSSIVGYIRGDLLEMIPQEETETPAEGEEEVPAEGEATEETEEDILFGEETSEAVPATMDDVLAMLSALAEKYSREYTEETMDAAAAELIASMDEAALAAFAAEADAFSSAMLTLSEEEQAQIHSQNEALMIWLAAVNMAAAGQIAAEEEQAAAQAAVQAVRDQLDALAVPEYTEETLFAVQDEMIAAKADEFEAYLAQADAAIEALFALGEEEKIALEAEYAFVLAFFRTLDVKLAFDALVADYYREYEDERWILFETMMALMDEEEKLACLDRIDLATAAFDALTESEQALFTAHYGEEWDFLSDLYEEILENAGSARAVASSSNWFDTDVTDGYYNIISEKHYGLISGATEAEIVLNNSSATRRQVVHVFNVDGSKVDILPGYYGIDKDVLKVENQTDAKVTDTAKYYENNLGYDLVGGMNIALAYDSNAPYTFLVYEGKVLQDYHSEDPLLNQHSGSCQTYLAIFKDGSCELRSRSQKLDGTEWHAVGANFGWLVKDGELVTKTPERTSSAASRSMLGILPNGNLIMCMVDGRGANNSIGLSNYEMGEFMLALGCVNAVNGDGGGSSTFISKREGENSLTMRSVPSDGAERPTIHSVFLAKKGNLVKGIFDHVNILSDYDYFVPNTTYTFGVQAIDTTGAEMDLPEGGVWSLADEAYGAITEDGVFTSNGTLGEVTVLYTVNETVAEKTITVTNPVVAKFTLDSTVLPFGKSTQMALDVWADERGEYPMYFEASSFDWNVNNDNAGTFSLEEMTYTATTNEDIPGVTITADYKHAQMPQLTFKIDFGKGSEILSGWDFENGDISEWLGIKDAIEWCQTNAKDSPLISANGNTTDINSPYGGNFSSNTRSRPFLASSGNGQVKNGKHALGIELDYTHASYSGWSYNMFFNVGGKRVLRDTANGQNATRLGAWVYIPEGAAGLAMQLIAYAGASEEAAKGTSMHWILSSSGKNLNSTTEADIPQNRWVYCYIDLTGYNYVATMDPYGNSFREPSFIRFYVKPMDAQNLVFYYDDITLDYSSAVDDRESPTIGAIQYATADTALDANGATIESSSAAFTATVADFVKNNATGLDTATAQIYLDGNKVDTQINGGSMSTAANVALENGDHVVTFEIADKIGNYTQVSAAFTVNYSTGSGLVYLDGHNDSGMKPEYDSVYYVDLKTSNIAKVQRVETNIRLNTANTWILENMIVAQGFKAEYKLLDSDREYTALSRSGDIHAVENVASIILTKTDACELKGEQTLVSIPVRVWSWDEEDTGVTAEKQFATGECPIITIDYDVRYGSVLTADEEVVTFGGSKSVETMLNDNLNPWHKHEVVALEDKAATCLEDGYAGRTYCEGCASVIEWGTTTPATGHSEEYDYYSGVLACPSCGTVKNVTGLIEHNGFSYYAIAGYLQKQWQQIGDDWYYFYSNTYKGANGALAGGSSAVPVEYQMENGKLVSGIWREINGQFRYYYGPDYHRTAWVTIDGEKYYFNDSGYRLTGYNMIKLSRYSKEDDYQMYLFAQDGKLLETLSTTGLLEANGKIYYLVNGIGNHAGLIKVGDDYYYINSEYVAVTGTREINAPWHNDLLPPGIYTFGEDGKMIIEQDETLNGIVGDYYYIDGVMQLTGLTKIGDDYYYFSTTNGVMSRNVTKMVYRIDASCDLPKGEYTFGEDGKLVLPKKNGIIDDYYYVDGVVQMTGLTKVGDDYYYFSTTNGVMSRSVTRMVYHIHESCDLPKGEYTFGADGKLVLPQKNGIVGDYYYIDGVMQLTGLTKIGDDYYYFSTTNGVMSRNVTKMVYRIDASCDLPKGEYTFGADGKLVLPKKNGIIDDYYYVDGVVQMTGLTKVGDDYYYFSTTNGVMSRSVTRMVYHIHESCDLPKGEYTFGADGKLVLPELNGIVGDYYYVDGVIQMTGLTKIGDDYYYFSTTNGVMSRNVTKMIYRIDPNCDLPKGEYTFGADGKVVF